MNYPETEKTLDQCFSEAENKYSRKVGNSNVDSLYPILRTIAKEGFKEWLEQLREQGQVIEVNQFIEKLLRELEL
jgi:hypothetical protein